MSRASWRRSPATRSQSEDIAEAIKVYNKSRAARREFVKLASDHCDVIDRHHALRRPQGRVVHG